MNKKENINEIKAGSLKGKFKNKMDSAVEPEQPVKKSLGEMTSHIKSVGIASDVTETKKELGNNQIEIGGKKYDLVNFFDASKLKKREIKNPPNFRLFKLIKQGKTKSGKGWLLCEYKGRKFLIEELALSYIAAKEVENGFEIDINKSVVVRTNDKGGLKLVPKVPPKLWFGLEEIKKKLAIGVNSDAISEIVAGSNLNLEIVENSRHGKFIAIQPDKIFHFDERHKIHIYPGKSVKEHGFENLSLIDFINKYDERLHFKAFEYEDKTYYRFYLKKIKNSFKEEDKKPITSEESEKEMLLNALKNVPNMDSDMVDAQAFMEALQINNLEKDDGFKKSSEKDWELL
jgi:hypothetical protein